jgi:hypothetical protein
MAATRIYATYTGTIQRESYPDFYNKAMDEFLKRPENVNIVLGQFATEHDSPTLVYDITEYGTVLDMPITASDTDPRPKTQPAAGYNTQITCVQKRMSVEITKTILKEDVSGGKARSMMNGLPNSMKKWIEYAISDVFDTAGSTAGADGSNLIANDHFHSDPRGGVWSNTETAGDLTTATYDTMRVSMRNRTDEKGHVMGITLKKIKVAPLFEGVAKRVLNSELLPGTGNNDINPWQGNATIVVDPYQGDTDEWWGFGDLPEENWGVHLVWFERPNVTALSLPSDAYPRVVAGFEGALGGDCAGSIMYNCHRNAGA